MPFPLSITGQIPLPHEDAVTTQTHLSAIADALRKRGALDVQQVDETITFWGPKSKRDAARERERRGEPVLVKTRAPAFTILGSVDRGKIVVATTGTGRVIRYDLSVRSLAMGTIVTTIVLLVVVMPALGDARVPLALVGVTWVVGFGSGYGISAVTIRRMLRRVGSNDQKR